MHQNVKIDNELSKLLHTIYNFRACLHNFMRIYFHFIYVTFLVENFQIKSLNRCFQFEEKKT